MSYRHLTLPLLALPFIIPIHASAESSDLETIVVTATRTPISIDKLLSSVSVITREEIERYNYQTLAEALNTLPGVVIANNGGLGKQTSLFLRGTESNHTQIILNGVKLATNEFGAPQLEHIPINQIERIELVRGPQSSLYGSESIGGTIQIFTKKGDGKISPNISVGYGTHDTKETTIGLSGGDDANWFNISLGYKESGGFNACDGRSATLFIGCFADEPDNDAYRNANSSISAGHRFSNGTELEIFSLHSKGKVEYDGFFNETDFLQHTFGSKLAFDISTIWSVTATLSQGRAEADNRGASSTSFANNKQNNFSLQNDIKINENHLLTIGYDYENDEIDESGGFNETERENNAVFVQLLGEHGIHNYRLSLRNNEDEQFGNYTTGNIAWGTTLSDNIWLHASYGTAFVAPSLIDLYNADFFGFPTSNPELDPERSESYEIGIAGMQARINWSANIFQTKIKDLIALDSSFVPQNISEADIKGFELQASTQLMGIHLDAQYSLVDPENASGGINNGNVLARRAKRTFTFNTYKSFGKFSLASKVFVSDRRFDNAANTRKIAGYTTVDLVGAYQVNNSTSLQLKIANLFDADYETVSGYNSDGANFFFSVNYRP
ncbi:MAG: TonB-dependent receptor [Methylophaga sp.]|nr:MAG: TonB-dependent receptor [Methylophaga sp.]